MKAPNFIFVLLIFSEFFSAFSGRFPDGCPVAPNAKRPRQRGSLPAVRIERHS